MKKNFTFKTLSYEEVIFLGKAQKNRKISAQHVNDFINMIKDSVFSDESEYSECVYGPMPIIINPITGHVLDGQHRLEAFKRAIEMGLIDARFKVLVGYWVIEDESAEKAIIIKLNSKSKNWTLNDYIECYTKDKESYLQLKEFCRTHQLCRSEKSNGEIIPNYRYGAAIIKGRGCNSVLKEERFECTLEELEEADTIHDEMLAIRNKLGIERNGLEIESMAAVWHQLRNSVNYKDILNLKYIPQQVYTAVRNTKDWQMVLGVLRNRIDIEKTRAAVA